MLVEPVVVFVDLGQVGSLVLVAVADVARTRLHGRLLFAALGLLAQLLFGDLLALHLGEQLSLHVLLGGAGFGVLGGGLVVAQDDLLLGGEFGLLVEGGLLLLLFDNRLGVVGELLALVLDLLELVALEVAFLVEGAQHVPPLVVLLHALDLRGVLLLRDGLLELVGVVLLVERLLNLLLRLLPLVRLHAVPLDGAPLVQVAPLVRRVVALVVLVERLDLLHFVLQGLLHPVLQL